MQMGNQGRLITVVRIPQRFEHRRRVGAAQPFLVRHTLLHRLRPNLSIRLRALSWTSPRMVDTQLSVYNHPGRSIMARKRRTYTPEFKAEAVRLVTEHGYSVAEAARSL